MPRIARKKSESGFYHVLLRGIGKQNIFEDNEDRERFISTVQRYKKELNFEVHAYCLMGNHVHILIKDTDDNIDLIFKKIAGSYAYYFNWKYDRVGHLFQDRFKSEVVLDDEYYLTVLRYIHQNPVKAGIAAVSKYTWSSYDEYVKTSALTDTKFALEMLGGKANFIEYMEESEEKICMEVISKSRLTDEKAIEIIESISKIKNIQDIQKFSIENRNELLKQLKAEGLSVRQISRLTGINRGVVLNA